MPAFFFALLFLLAPAISLAAPAEPQTLWLVRPLYPGQEALVPRAEASIRKMLPSGEGRDLLGRQQLMHALSGSKATLDCIFGPAGCPDPIGALLNSSGVQRAVLLQVGQEGGTYRFRAASFEAGSEQVASAESTNSDFNEGLLVAVVRVAPLASVVELISDPPGAKVFVDGEALGTTPLSTQIMPGERKLRLELAGYEPVERKEPIPARGKLRLEHKLNKMPGSIYVHSPGATIFINGEKVGEGEVEVGSPPGVYLVRLERAGYEPYEHSLTLEAEQRAKVEHELEPGAWESILQALSRNQEEIYEKGAYLALTYDHVTLTGDKFKGQATKTITTKLDGLKAPASSKARVHAFGVEFGSLWRHGGVMWIGGSYFQSFDEWSFGMKDGGLSFDPRSRRPLEPQTDEFHGTLKGLQLRFLQPQLRVALWRFVLGARGGFLGRGGWISSSDETFVMGDFGVEARGSLQYHIYEGFFAELGYGHGWTLLGSTDGTSEWRGGIVYAF